MPSKQGVTIVLVGFLLLLSCLCTGGPLQAQEDPFVAELIALTGQAEVKTGGGSYRAAQVRDKLRVGDTIRTLEQSRAKLFFQDESVTILAEKTTLEINQYHVNTATRERTGVLKAVEGKIRFLVQKISGAPPPAMTIESEVLSVGVRGTDGILATGKQHQVYLLESENPLDVRNKFTGQTLQLPPMQFLLADKKGPFQVNPITPGMLDSLTQQFRLTYDFTPKNLLSPGAPPDMFSLTNPGEGTGTTVPPVTQQPLPTLHLPIVPGHVYPPHTPPGPGPTTPPSS